MAISLGYTRVYSWLPFVISLVSPTDGLLEIHSWGKVQVSWSGLVAVQLKKHEHWQRKHFKFRSWELRFGEFHNFFLVLHLSTFLIIVNFF